MKTEEGTRRGRRKEGEGYEYVEFAAREMPGFRSRVIRADQAAGLARRFGGRGCFTTCFLFDRSLARHAEERRTVAGFHGKVHAHYLPVDIDHKDLGMATATTIAMVSSLKNDLQVQDEAILIYFSGMKGFHLMIDVRAFGGVEASDDLHLVFDRLRRLLARVARLDSECIDFSIRDKLRLWRLPNTRHEVSGLYKIRLRRRELLGLTPDRLRVLAVRPRFLSKWDQGCGLLSAPIEIRPNKKAMVLARDAARKVREKRPPRLTPNDELALAGATPGRFLCQAEKSIWSEGVPKGMRNNSALRLATRFRDLGIEKDEVERLLLEWNTRGIGLEDREIRQVVDSAYQPGREYRFGCRDAILASHCPYRKDWNDCREYRLFRALAITATETTAAKARSANQSRSDDKARRDQVHL